MLQAPPHCARWLQYHDKDTGNLMGMLPLAIGMPITFTEHIDRSDKQILRNTRGFVHSWVWPKSPKQPSTVYVKIPDAPWQLDGIDEPGVYPIVPRSSPSSAPSP